MTTKENVEWNRRLDTRGVSYYSVLVYWNARHTEHKLFREGHYHSRTIVMTASNNYSKFSSELTNKSSLQLHLQYHVCPGIQQGSYSIMFTHT